MKYSIVIATYNHGKYIREAIESALKQDDAEVIVVNDGSTDNTLRIAKEYNVKLIDKKNTGVADSRNKGIEMAKGEYIICLDSDDILVDDFTNTVNYFSFDIIVVGYKTFGDESKVFVPTVVNKTTQNMFNQLCVTCPFRKDYWKKVGGFDTKLKGYEDWDLFNRMLKVGASIDTIPLPLLMYRKHANARNLDAVKEHELLKAKVTKC